MPKPNEKTLAVVGLGYVGWPLVQLAAEKGWQVVGLDINQNRLKTLEKEKPNLVTLTANSKNINGSRVIVITVPTPVHEDRTPDLGPVESASRAIAPEIKPGTLVVLESTVNPAVTDTIVRPILEAGSNLKAGTDFHLAHCPERVDPGNKTWTLENIPRVVGGLTPACLSHAIEFYRSILKAGIKPMGSLREAEAVKIVENSFRDINIAFVNELAKSFSKLGIDVVHVIEGAATKPFAFMAHFPGAGVGGHCIPVDPYYLIQYAAENGFEHEFLSLARKINSHMPAFTVEQTEIALKEKGKSLKGSTVAVLGLAYKPEIEDCRESPAFEVIHELKVKGANVKSYDPYVPARSDVASLEEALHGADAAIVTTAHNAFKSLKPKDFLSQNVTVIIDGRNCLPKEEFVTSGIVYRGIGR